MFTGAPNTVIQNNLVSGNTGSGLFVSGDGAEILGNSIGTSRNGTTALGNDRSGIRLQTASGILIGGPKPDQRNLISGNGEYGIHVKGKNLDEHTVIQGNRIGTNRAGTGALANGKSGIYIEDASRTDIGGPFPEYGNLISGNSGHGIRVVGATTTVTNTSISNNQIGTDQAGNAGVGNGKSGVFLDNAVQSDIFDNVIASNGVSGDGVTVVSDSGTSQRNRISFNRMFRNGDLGIDLAKDGVTANDPGDPDDGPNRRQNFPNLTAATIDRTGNLVVSYRVPTAVANGAYPVGVEFFEADNSGREGKAVLGFVNYPARAAGTVRQANLGPALALGVAAGDSIVATATDDRGSTSEFSASVTVERDNGTRDNATRIDFGDAPVNDTRYPTLSANAGPSHVVRAGFHLGETIDADPDGQPNATASGDDTDGTDDEDGVALNGPWTIDGEHRITVNASASGRLDAWIDWNADGDWRDPGEGIVTDANLSAGNNTLTVNVSSDAPTGKTFARFRFSSGGGLGPTGRASDGEVEDYNVTVVKGTGLDGTAARYDTDDDGEISIGELGTAASDYAKGDLTITELGDVASAYASS